MLTLAAWLHNIDPFALKFPDGFLLPGIRWYGLAYLATFVIGYFFTRRVVKFGISTLRPAEVMDFVIAVAIAVVIGGRLGYVIFYKPALLISFSNNVPFWGVLQLNEGGMSSHGGMIGVGVATWWYAWRSRKKAVDATKAAQIAPNRVDAGGRIIDHTRCYRCEYDLQNVPVTANCPECGAAVQPSFFPHRWLHLFDLTALVATLGFLFGRIANFINAELVGRVCSPGLPWAVKFPQDLYEVSATLVSGKPDASAQAAATLHQLAPAVENVVIEGIAVSPEAWAKAIDDKNIRFIDRTIHGIIDLIQSGSSQGQLVGSQVEPLLLPHHPSQIYAMITEGLIIFLVLLWLWRKPQKPGVICGTFGALYGVMRVFNEFFRTPDAHIANQEFATIGLTRGQLLSIVLAIGGAVLTWWAAKRNTPRMGGWRGVEPAPR